MGTIKAIVRHFFGERRHEDQPVPEDRRAPRVKMKDADDMLHNAIKDLEKTVRMNRDQLFK
jgi:hypothetical protein